MDATFRTTTVHPVARPTAEGRFVTRCDCGWHARRRHRSQRAAVAASRTHRPDCPYGGKIR